MARWRLLAESCDTGPCPTLYTEPESGEVTVQGYRTSPPGPIPAHEDVVLIPAKDWATLLSRLPLRMLLRAILAKPTSRRPATSAAPPVPAAR